jgi:riboflavin biosynthesis pyrimidine reductase
VDVRVLTGSDLAGELSDKQLDELYAVPARPWLRVNMVSTIDGAATGEGGKSSGINNAADKRVFDALRRLCDAVIVGAGTARAEGYRDVEKPLVLVSRGAAVPKQLRDAPAGAVRMATFATAAHLDEARAVLGDDHVHVLGEDRVDLAELKRTLAGLGFTSLLSEGGPSLLRDLLDQGVVDELDVTTVPRVLASGHLRIAVGPPVDVTLSLALLLEDEGTLLGRWLT